MTYLLAFTLGLAVRHYLPIAAGYIAVKLKQVRWHGQTQ